MSRPGKKRRSRQAPSAPRALETAPEPAAAEPRPKPPDTPASDAPPPLPWLSPARLAVAVAIAALAVYLRTVAPTVTSEDSGELITAVSTWGVAHPPGYPLYCLLAKAFLLLPVGSAALRVNIASAAFGATAAGVLVLVAIRAGAPRHFAAVSALAWAFARDVWAQAVIAEVYTLNALLLSATLLLLLRWSDSRKHGDLYFAAAAFGLSLANHYPLALLAAPAMAVFVFRTARAAPTTPTAAAPIERTVWLRAAALALAGLLFYAYLPICASLSPPINWGDPSTPSRFVAHVARTAYRNVEFGETATLETKAQFAALFLRLLARQWTAPVLLVLGALGIYHLRRRAPARDLFLGIAVTTALGLIVLPNYTYEHENIQRVDELYLPAYVALAPVLACGLASLTELANRASSRFAACARARAALATAILGSAVFVVPLTAHFRDNDLSSYTLAEDYNRFILESLPEHSVYFTSGDYTSFPTLYLQATLGVRRDVLLANVTGELSPAAEALLASIDPAAPPDAAALQEALVRRAERPLFIAAKSDLHVAAQARPWGLVYSIQRERAPQLPPPPDLIAANLRLPPSVPAADGLGKSLLSDYRLMRGEALFARGDTPAARDSLLVAAELLPGSREGLNNIGSTLAEHGLGSDAERLFRAAAALSPSYVTPRRNLARLLDSMGRTEDAVAAYRDLVRAAPDDSAARARLDALLSGHASPSPARPPQAERIDALLRAIEREPSNPALYNNLGNVYAEDRDGARAREAYEKALSIDPGYALAYKNLALLHRDVFGDAAAADAYLQKYRSLGGQ